MPRFLVDENLSHRLARFLGSLGYDAVAIRTVGLRGTSDAVIAKWAKANHRVMVTRDRDFAEVFFWHTPRQLGVVLIQSVSQQARAHEAI
jgi:predicted nuclease of predicted toxin-antitoxin system